MRSQSAISKERCKHPTYSVSRQSLEADETGMEDESAWRLATSGCDQIGMTCGYAARCAEKLRFSGLSVLDCGGYAAVVGSSSRASTAA